MPSIKSQDLNLLQIFSAIMTERSVTRAADQLSTTQPAVSNAIARMRDLWKDPVFVKSGRNIEPTAFAYNFWRQIRGPLTELTEAVNFKKFDPSESQREFRVAVSDFFVDIAWLPLVQELSKSAPRMNIYASPFSMDESSQQLKEAKIDLVLGPLTDEDHSFRSSRLGEGDMVLAMRRDHPLAIQGSITTKDFTSASHILVTSTKNATGVVDQILERTGLSRRVAVTVNHFSAVPKLLEKTDFIATIPRVVSGSRDYRSGLVFLEHPLEMDPFPIELTWHKRNDSDAEFEWFKQLFIKTVNRQFGQCQKYSQMNSKIHNMEDIPMISVS